jgi:excisionase family DNA binding protein
MALHALYNRVVPYDTLSYHDKMAVDPGGRELTVHEAAALVRRNPETIRRWVRAGRLPHRRVGTTILLYRDDLLDLVSGLEEPAMLALPEAWQRAHSGAPMPNLAAAVHRTRAGR